MNISVIFDKTPRFLLYALFLLMPMFFVPGLSLPLDLHKQMLFAVIVFAVGILWVVDILRRGVIRFKTHILLIPLAFFVAISIVSAKGSGAFIHSFWGANGTEPDSLLNIILFALLFVILFNQEKDFTKNAMRFFAGGAVLGFLFLFARSVFFSSLSFGSTHAFLIYSGGALLYFFLKHQRQKSPRKRRSLSVDFAILAIFLTVLFLSVFFRGPFSFAEAPRLGHKMTMGILASSISSDVKNAVFGSGPATFQNQYMLHRSPSINSSPLWNTVFDKGTGAISSIFVTSGLLGGGLLLLFWLLFLWHGRKGAFPIFALGAYFFAAWFLYDANFLLLFAGFLTTGLYGASMGSFKQIRFSRNTRIALVGISGGAALLISFAALFYVVFRGYAAEVNYARAVQYMERKDYASAISRLQNAARLKDSDRYWRKISQAIFLTTSDAFFQNKNLSQGEKEKEVQRGITAAGAAAIQATVSNPVNSENFEQLGDFYRTIIPISENAATLPFPSYNKAAALNPQSPYIPLKIARAHLANAKRFAAKNTDRAREAYAKAIEEARREANNALALKKDFVEAIDFLASLPLSN